MIVYLSNNRIENLYAENIIKRPNIIDVFKSRKKFSLKLKDVEASTEFDGYPDNYVSMAKEVLCELKAKKRIHYLFNKEHIDLQKYYYIFGRLSVDNDSRKDIYDKDEYDANDIIGINIKAPNDYYDKIHLYCSVSSIKTMSYHINEKSQKKYYFGSARNIVKGPKEVEVIFIADNLDENSKTICGTPIIITYSDDKLLEKYVSGK